MHVFNVCNCPSFISTAMLVEKDLHAWLLALFCSLEILSVFLLGLSPFSFIRKTKKEY